MAHEASPPQRHRQNVDEDVFEKDHVTLRLLLPRGPGRDKCGDAFAIRGGKHPANTSQIGLVIFAAISTPKIVAVLRTLPRDRHERL